MNFQFYGYILRSTTEDDLELAALWTGRNDLMASVEENWADLAKAHFWLMQGKGRQSFLVSQALSPDGAPARPCEALAFLQVEMVDGDARLHWQPSPVASAKKLLRGITLLVPLMEKGLASGGVKHIFFTSHSLTMVTFMEKRLGYRLAKNTDGGEDGVVMFKEISGQPETSAVKSIDSAKVEFHASAVPATLPPHCGSVLRVVADAPSSAGAARQEPTV
jgi:hypothetical protein